MTSNGAVSAAESRPVLPFGSWPSPLRLEALTAKTVGFSQPAVGMTSSWWVESRPDLAGRSVLVRCPHDAPAAQPDAAPTPQDLDLRLPDGSPADVRSRVHEYGGLAYAVADGMGVVVDASTDALYCFDVPRDPATTAPVRLTALTVPSGARYGDPAIDLSRGVVYAVREDHDRQDAAGHPVNELVSVPLDGSATHTPDAVRVLVGDHDFVTTPTPSRDGTRLACIAWDHPAMPWTSSMLLVLDITTPGAAPVHVAGGNGVAVQNPVWGSDGDLFFLDDSSGFMNPYRLQGAATATPQELTEGEARLRVLHQGSTEFGLPQWGLGPRTMATVGGEFLVAIGSDEGRRTLVALRRDNGQAEEWTGDFEPVGGLAARDGHVLVIAASASRGPVVLALDIAHATTRVLAESAPQTLPEDGVSRAEALSWESVQHDGSVATAHGFWFPPASTAAQGPEGELPPVIVTVHGGPTAAAGSTYSTGVQFWTSRGIGVLEVNYGGSTGYGRAYQDRLEGRWGLVDVADCVSGARFLAESGRADATRMAIAGGSAGGYTVLAALTGSEVFSAGISSYGIGDLEALVRDTHKFESRYPDSLIAPYPEQAQVYQERSPLHHVDRLTAPVLVLQGGKDAVVPPAQAHLIVDALRAKDLPVALVEFPEEGHGFRQAQNIQAAAAAKLSFLGQVWGFTPDGDVPTLAVENLPGQSG